jgi:hypothetical protein
MYLNDQEQESFVDRCLFLYFIYLSVLWVTVPDYTFSICLFFELRFLITRFVSLHSSWTVVMVNYSTNIKNKQYLSF